MGLENEMDAINFETCKPCYLDCIGQAATFDTASSWQEIYDIFYKEPSEDCTQACGSFCKPYSQIFGLYMSDKTANFAANNDADPIQNKLARYTIRRCAVEEFEEAIKGDNWNQETITEIASSPMFENHFGQSCFYDVFNQYWNFNKRSSEEIACKPCYDVCIKNKLVYSFKSIDDFYNLIQGHDDVVCDTDNFGQKCPGTCLSYKDMLAKYLFEAPNENNLTGNDEPIEAANGLTSRVWTAGCFRNEFGVVTGVSLTDLETEYAEKKDDLIDFTYERTLRTWSNQRNSCLRKILDNHQDSPPAGTETFAANFDQWNKCHWCYGDCFGKETTDMNNIGSYNDLLDFLDHGSEKWQEEEQAYRKCSRVCERWLSNCMGWSDLATALFKDPATGNYNDEFKQCMDEEISYEVKLEAQAMLSAEEYQNLFNSDPY